VPDLLKELIRKHPNSLLTASAGAPFERVDYEETARRARAMLFPGDDGRRNSESRIGIQESVRSEAE